MGHNSEQHFETSVTLLTLAPSLSTIHEEGQFWKSALAGVLPEKGDWVQDSGWSPAHLSSPSQQSSCWEGLDCWPPGDTVQVPGLLDDMRTLPWQPWRILPLPTGHWRTLPWQPWKILPTSCQTWGSPPLPPWPAWGSPPPPPAPAHARILPTLCSRFPNQGPAHTKLEQPTLGSDFPSSERQTVPNLRKGIQSSFYYVDKVKMNRFN